MLAAPYLVTGLHFGLVNQQITLLNAIAAAVVLNYTLVLPPYSLDWRQNYRAADLVPLFEFHDEAHFAAKAQEHGLLYVKELPPEYFSRCIQQLQSRHSHTVMPLEDIQVKVQRHGVACLKSHHSIFLDKTFPAAGPPLAYAFGKVRASAMDTFLRPATVWADAANALVADMLARYNVTRFVAVHLRVERDWIEACFSEAWFKLQHEQGAACYVGEEQFHDHLTQRRNVSAGTVVFVAGGNRPGASSKLCMTYRCMHHTDLRSVFNGPPLAQYKSLTGEGYLDLLVLGQASEFYGNPMSTFSAFAGMAVKGRGGYAENVVLPPPAVMQGPPSTRRRLALRASNIKGSSREHGVFQV